MNKYDLEHVCTDHPIMSRDTWRQVYKEAWTRYYSDAHVETVMRRARADGIPFKKVVDALTIFSGSLRIEGVHPLQFGLVRRKIRTQRRHGLAIENPLIFYPRWGFEALLAGLRWVLLFRRYRKIMRRIEADPASESYTDHALRRTHEADDFVENTFAAKIPDTYGAPPKHAPQPVQAAE